MATFSYQYARAVHVLPLHALKGILEERALLAKRDLARRSTAAVRATTSLTDAVLGLSDYIHFYLLRQAAPWESIPILATQLLEGRDAPFPHVALETETSSLKDDECTLCLWNIAVSRPGVQGICQGGNWTRGTNPNRILEVWRAFRRSVPEVERARGYWNEPIQVPTLRGSQILDGRRFLGRAASGIPELLLRAPLRGWANYYGRFHPSALKPLWKHVNDYLVRWMRRKYKRLACGVTRAARALGSLAERAPRSFVHWEMGFFPAAR